MNTPNDRQTVRLIHLRTASRRRFVSTAIAMPALFAAGATAGAQGTPDATAVATPLAGQSTSLLAVADPANEHLYIYSLPDLTYAGEIHGVVVQTHAGFLPMPNGDLLFVDELGSRLVSVGMVGDAPEILGEAPVTGTVSHVAIDGDHAHYAAVGSDDLRAPITLVDLETWETTPVVIPDTGEVGLMLTHDVLFHRNDVLNRIEAYPLAALLAGDVAPTSTVEIGAGGHGESIAVAQNRLFCATDDGVDVAEWDGTGLTYVTTYPWSDDGSISGRGYFQRLTFDGRYVVSYISDRSAPETEWTTWTNNAMVVDTESGAVLRPEIGDGYVFRFGLANDLALFYVMGAAGDEAVILDLDSTSATFGDISARVQLDPMTTGPATGDPIYEVNQYRAVNVTPDGAMGFVTQGGDGLVTVIDPGTGDVTGSIETPTDLSGGGYLAVFGGPDSFVDTIAR